MTLLEEVKILIKEKTSLCLNVYKFGWSIVYEK